MEQVYHKRIAAWEGHLQKQGESVWRKELQKEAIMN